MTDQPTPTERQRAALNRLVAEARLHGADAPPWRDGWPWHTRWDDEVRPGRGHDLSTVLVDGDHIVSITIDVYGNGGGLAVARLDWVHADADEDCACDRCIGARGGA